MKAPTHRTAAAGVIVVYAALLVLAATATAKVIHENVASFPKPGAVNLIAVDNSLGPSGGRLYVGEVSFSFASRVFQTDASGVATGVDLNAAETPAGSFGFLSSKSVLASGPAVAGTGANAGDVYVPDIAHGVVDLFNDAGKYVCQITGNATPSATECAGATGSETPSGGIEPTSVAVDPVNGQVAVGEANGVLDVFSEKGGYMREMSDPHITDPFSLAFDSTGSLYVVNANPLAASFGSAVKFSATGGFERELATDKLSVGVDVATGHVYLAGPSGEVEEFNMSGKRISTFGPASGFGSGAYTIAVSKATSDVYLTPPSAENEIWGGDTFIPNVTTAQASEVNEATATLHGDVDPEVSEGASEITSCRFEFIQAAGYKKAIEGKAPNPYVSGQSVLCSPAVPYSSATAVVAALSGLAPSSTYHYRLVAENKEGKGGDGEDFTFTTFGAAGIGGETASAITTTAILRAQVDPFGYQTTCHMQYVSSAKFVSSGYAEAKTVPCVPESLGAGFSSAGVSAAIGGLTTDTTYHYRFVTSNAGGTTTGADETFSTFGVESFGLATLGPEERPYMLAGGHPYELTDTFTLNTSTDQFGTPFATDANPKDIVTDLPPGLIGNPNATPKCGDVENVKLEMCSGASQVGVLRVYTANPSFGQPEEHKTGLFNVAPQNGVAAEFAGQIAGVANVTIAARVRTGFDYGVTAEVVNASAGEGLVGTQVTLWGAPAEAGHDGERECRKIEGAARVPCDERGLLRPFLRNPSSCRGSPVASMRVDSWQEPGAFVAAESNMPAITGCGKLDFKPSIIVEPTSTASDSPSGLHVEIKMPQNENPYGLAEADLKDAAVTLPEGVTVNPSSASGLIGCPLLNGKEGHAGQSGIDLENAEAANCPNASKIGKVTIKTPLLDEELHGGVYVAQQNANPFKSLLALYIAAEAPKRGVVVKLAGDVQLDESTGQLTTTFDENPQLPFETLKLDLFGGERAPLATPRTCDSYEASALLEPFSHQGAPGEAGTPDAQPAIAPFEISSAPGGAPCDPPPFSPSLQAGALNNQAGAFGTFAITLTRKAGEERFSTVGLTMPPGLAGMISNVPLCSEARASAGSCPASSKIGHVVAQAGVGGQPLTIPQAGMPEDPVYLTEKYEGAPFGLSIVVPAQAGPFDLGTVVVRARIEVDPHTAQVSVISNPMPTMLRGIPLDVQAIHVEIDREAFIFNPTDCAPMSVGASIGSAEGATASLTDHFQAGNCANLPFKPSFSVLTHAAHSRTGGAYLQVAVGSGSGQANISKVHVVLPKALPSRLTTLQQACTEAQFAANPAGCPPGSVVGSATANTPILPVPLTGPAIFVSHGGAAFPNLDILLQGEGVDITLVGDTFIEKGITTSTFASVPDVPVSRFQLVLPEGPHSALAANGDLCAHALYMPTTITGHNGAQIEQRTHVTVSGCRPTIKVIAHRVTGRHATVVVRVPAAGTLVASGGGVVRKTRRAAQPGTVTMTLRLSEAEQRFVAHHHGRRLKVPIRLSFSPAHGPRLSARVAVLMT
ncbi:MAG: hypothetical protein FWD42_06270 [Solirubrobacterales bacterium]|nr:hypothetical protein [Solirubrobacterales bacterium]